MANPTTNYGFVLPTSTDLVTDLPADFDIALQGVDTRLKALQPGTTSGDLAYSSATANTNLRLPIGTTGQVLAVVAGVPAWQSPNPGDITAVTAGVGISGGGTSGDVTVTNSMATAIDAKGDLVVGTGADAFSRLAVGATNGMVLTVDSAEATGLKYATPGGGYTPDMFGVTKSGDQGFSAGTWTKVTSWTELYDIGADFETPKFTTPLTSYYSFSAIVRTYASTTAAANRQVLALYKNGALVRTMAATNNMTDVTLSGSTTLYLNVNDFIEIYIYNDNSSPTVEAGSTSWVGQFIRT